MHYIMCSSCNNEVSDQWTANAGIPIRSGDKVYFFIRLRAILINNVTCLATTGKYYRHHTGYN